MADKNKGIIYPRPYARLLTMIGDQLIKNEKVALVELIKNSYDADANWVQIRFNHFEIENDQEQTLKKSPLSSIEIEDDGVGMTYDTIKTVWLNPATPNKYSLKKAGKNVTKTKKRLIQGEKGIGRFAVYKLGTTIELITRSENANEKEVVLINDLSGFDDEIIQTKKSDPPKYLDQIEYLYEIQNKPKHILPGNILIQNRKVTRPPHGTILRITNLRGEWSMTKIDTILSDVGKLNSPVVVKKPKDEFVCDFVINGESKFDADKDDKNELEILRPKAPIRVENGSYNGKSQIELELNGKNVTINLNRLLENKEFRKRFASKEEKSLKREPQCGPFTFQFYIYDFTSQAPPKYKLLTDEKEIIRKNRIYLYRDGIRVFPYGDKSDDWLEIDILRGTGRAGDYLSNDQTVGFIGISARENSQLKDKTNREGLLEIGNAFEDFKVLIQSVLGFLHKEFKKYKFALDQKNKIISSKDSITQNQFETFHTLLKEKKDNQSAKAFEIIYKNYLNEKKYLTTRADITEDLAAVGISVEAASHDLMMMMQKAKSTINVISEMTKVNNFDYVKLNQNILKLSNQLSFIESQIEGIQPIFRSSKRQLKEIKISESIKSVLVYFKDQMDESNIKLEIEEPQKSLRVHVVEAVLLQTFINLFDNAIYWLNTTDSNNKRIKVVIDKTHNKVIFSDNGPGISSDDIPYIFEPFFSTKGLEGRGLGLYIAKQLLSRHDFDIDYITNSKLKILSGANFSLEFNDN